MILTREMAEKAKELVGKDRFSDVCVCGVCLAIDAVSGSKIKIYLMPELFWRGNKVIKSNGAQVVSKAISANEANLQELRRKPEQTKKKRK
jgi:hypothetical protein